MEYNDESGYKRREASDFRGCCRSGLVIHGADGRRSGAEKEVHTGTCEGSAESGCLRFTCSVNRKKRKIVYVDARGIIEDKGLLNPDEVLAEIGVRVKWKGLEVDEARIEVE